MTDLDKNLREYFEDRGFRVLEPAVRLPSVEDDLGRMPPIAPLQAELRARTRWSWRGRRRSRKLALTSGPRFTKDDLVVLRIEPIAAAGGPGRGAFSVIFSRSRGGVIGEQD